MAELKCKFFLWEAFADSGVTGRRTLKADYYCVGERAAIQMLPHVLQSPARLNIQLPDFNR
eukprot:5409775-Amphidinium_carterae.1